MVNGMDRLAAALSGRQSDRIPVICNLFEQGARELGLGSLKEYYSSGDHVAEAQLRMRERYGYDNVWNLFYVAKEAELLGCSKIIYAEDGPPNVGELVIRDLADIGRLRVPEDIAAHPAFAECAKCMKTLVREVGGRQPILSYVTSCTALPVMLMGMERWIELLMAGPASARDELLSICCEFSRKYLAYQMAAGATCFLYASPLASTSIMPMAMIDEIIFPWMERELAGFRRDGLVFFCGQAAFNNVIARVVSRLGISNFYLSPMSSITEAKSLVAERGLVCGSINDMKLMRWSRNEVRAEVKRILAEGMPGNRFAFTVQLMPMGVPEENIRHMLDAAYEFGAFPASAAVRT